MPVELGLELMAIVRPDLAEAERKLFDDVIREIDGVGLGVLFLDLQGANARCIIDGCVLETTYLLTFFTDESQKLNIHLNVMTRDLFLIALGMNLAHAGTARKTVHPVPTQNT